MCLSLQREVVFETSQAGDFPTGSQLRLTSLSVVASTTATTSSSSSTSASASRNSHTGTAQGLDASRYSRRCSLMAGVTLDERPYIAIYDVAWTKTHSDTRFNASAVDSSSAAVAAAPAPSTSLGGGGVVNFNVKKQGGTMKKVLSSATGTALGSTSMSSIAASPGAPVVGGGGASNSSTITAQSLVESILTHNNYFADLTFGDDLLDLHCPDMFTSSDVLGQSGNLFSVKY